MDTPYRLLPHELVLTVLVLTRPTSQLAAVSSTITTLIRRDNRTLRAWTDIVIFKSHLGSAFRNYHLANEFLEVRSCPNGGRRCWFGCLHHLLRALRVIDQGSAGNLNSIAQEPSASEHFLALPGGNGHDLSDTDDALPPHIVVGNTPIRVDPYQFEEHDDPFSLMDNIIERNRFLAEYNVFTGPLPQLSPNRPLAKQLEARVVATAIAALSQEPVPQPDESLESAVIRTCVPSPCHRQLWRLVPGSIILLLFLVRADNVDCFKVLLSTVAARWPALLTQEAPISVWRRIDRSGWMWELQHAYQDQLISFGQLLASAAVVLCCQTVLETVIEAFSLDKEELIQLFLRDSLTLPDSESVFKDMIRHAEQKQWPSDPFINMLAWFQPLLPFPVVTAGMRTPLFMSVFNQFDRPRLSLDQPLDRRHLLGTIIANHTTDGELFDLIELGLQHNLFSNQSLGRIIATAVYSPLSSIGSFFAHLDRHIAQEQWHSVLAEGMACYSTASGLQQAFSKLVDCSLTVYLTNPNCFFRCFSGVCNRISEAAGADFIVERGLCPARFAFTCAGAFSNEWLRKFLGALQPSQLQTYQCKSDDLELLDSMVTGHAGRFSNVAQYGFVLHFLLSHPEQKRSLVFPFPNGDGLSRDSLSTLIILALSVLKLYAQGRLAKPAHVSQHLPQLTNMWLACAKSTSPNTSFTSTLAAPYLAAAKRFLSLACSAFYRNDSFVSNLKSLLAPVLARGSDNDPEVSDEEDDYPEPSHFTPEVSRGFDCLLKLERHFVVSNMQWNQSTPYWVWDKFTAGEVAETMTTFQSAVRAVYSAAVDEANSAIVDVLDKVPQHFVTTPGFANAVIECLYRYGQGNWPDGELGPDVHGAVEGYLSRIKAKPRRIGSNALPGMSASAYNIYDEDGLEAIYVDGGFDSENYDSDDCF